jgi:hypothetical protein
MAIGYLTFNNRQPGLGLRIALTTGRIQTYIIKVKSVYGQGTGSRFFRS